MSGTAFRFPSSDDRIDLAVACSVFTHMLADEIENYVAEVFRIFEDRRTLLHVGFLVRRRS